jgi:hypothetical protein
VPVAVSVSLVVLGTGSPALTVQGTGQDQRSDQSERERGARPGESRTGHYRSPAFGGRFVVVVDFDPVVVVERPIVDVEVPVVVGVVGVVEPVRVEVFTLPSSTSSFSLFCASTRAFMVFLVVLVDVVRVDVFTSSSASVSALRVWTVVVAVFFTS